MFIYSCCFHHTLLSYVDFIHYAGMKMKQDPVKIWLQNNPESPQVKSPESALSLKKGTLSVAGERGTG